MCVCVCVCLMTVSYTHLDVYKRQVKHGKRDIVALIADTMMCGVCTIYVGPHYCM